MTSTQPTKGLPMKRNREWKAIWAGFEGGKIMSIQVDAGWGGFGNGDMVMMPAIFRTRAEARKKFQDVRRIEIRGAKIQ